MNEFPKLWSNLLNSETGLPVVVNSVQKIMDARYHPDHISMHDEFELVYMQEIDKQYPQYFFAKHKGYSTKLHMDILRELGPSPVHRRSFLKFLDK